MFHTIFNEDVREVARARVILAVDRSLERVNPSKELT